MFGDVEAETAGEVLRNWDQIKREEEGREPGVFGDVPENLPSTLYARKLLRRAESAGHGIELKNPTELVERLEEDGDFAVIGELLLVIVHEARKRRVDPELALRAAADSFRQQFEEEA